MRVLVAEDDFWVAMLIESILLAAGHDAIPVATYAAAKESVLADPPDAAVVDMRLQDGLSGPALARALVWAGIPTIICSANPAAHHLVDGLPVVAVLAKPIIPERLHDALRQRDPQSMLDG